MKRFTIVRDQDAWVKFGPIGGWWWVPTRGDQTDFQQYWTKWGAWFAGWRATSHRPKENPR